jgi:hypothetical protein
MGRCIGQRSFVGLLVVANMAKKLLIPRSVIFGAQMRGNTPQTDLVVAHAVGAGQDYGGTPLLPLAAGDAAELGDNRRNHRFRCRAAKSLQLIDGDALFGQDLQDLSFGRLAALNDLSGHSLSQAVLL